MTSDLDIQNKEEEHKEKMEAQKLRNQAIFIVTEKCTRSEALDKAEKIEENRDNAEENTDYVDDEEGRHYFDEKLHYPDYPKDPRDRKKTRAIELELCEQNGVTPLDL